MSHSLCAPGHHTAKSRRKCTIKSTFLPITTPQIHWFGYWKSESNISMHHYECVALCKDTSLQRGRFCIRYLSQHPWRQVITNVLHPNFAWLPRRSPQVLCRRFKDGLASICVLIHSCKMPKESQTMGLNDGWKWWLVGNATNVGISDKVVPMNVQDSS